MGPALSRPAPPPLTEANLPDQAGKVFIVTGATSGIGAALSKILYNANAKVWIVARSAAKAAETIQSIRSTARTSQGSLQFLQVDFNDLRTIKSAVNDLKAQESHIDVLWNNAGIMIPPKGSLTEQGYEAQLGVNNLGPFLFTKLLAPLLSGSLTGPRKPRIVWVSSSAARGFSPPGGVDMEKLGVANEFSQWQNYGVSKAGNILHAAEFGSRYNVVSVAVDPGNLDTGLYQHMPKWQALIARKLALKPAIFGAYSELYAGLSADVETAQDGSWVVPWGKLEMPRVDILASCHTDSEGKESVARRFWEWCEAEVQQYM